MMIFRCPSCKEILRYGGAVRYQMSDEHIMNPNSELGTRAVYYCKNLKCDASAPDESKKRILHIEKKKKIDPNNIRIFWDEQGCIYSSGGIKIKFINNNDAPFGSFQRQANIEIYKKDENFILLNIWLFYIKIIFKYRSNHLGEILSKRPKFELWIRKGNMYLLHVSNIRMFFYLLGKFKRTINNYYEPATPGNIMYATKDIKDSFERQDNRFYFLMFKVYINVFYWKLRNNIKG